MCLKGCRSSHTFNYVDGKCRIYSPPAAPRRKPKQSRREHYKKNGKEQKSKCYSANYCATAPSAHLEDANSTWWMKHLSRRGLSSSHLYLDNAVGSRKAAQPPVPLWCTRTPSPPMRKDQGLRAVERKNNWFKSYSQSSVKHLNISYS